MSDIPLSQIDDIAAALLTPFDFNTPNAVPVEPKPPTPLVQVVANARPTTSRFDGVQARSKTQLSNHLKNSRLPDIGIKTVAVLLISTIIKCVLFMRKKWL